MATWESLGVGKKYQLMSPGPLLTELQPLQAVAGVGNQRGNTKGNADPWVRDNKVAPQKTGDRTQSPPGVVHCDFYLASPSIRCHPRATLGAGASTSRAQVLRAVRCWSNADRARGRGEWSTSLTRTTGTLPTSLYKVRITSRIQHFDCNAFVIFGILLLRAFSIHI